MDYSTVSYLRDILNKTTPGYIPVYAAKRTADEAIKAMLRASNALDETDDAPLVTDEMLEWTSKARALADSCLEDDYDPQHWWSIADEDEYVEYWFEGAAGDGSRGWPDEAKDMLEKMIRDGFCKNRHTGVSDRA